MAGDPSDDVEIKKGMKYPGALMLQLALPPKASVQNDPELIVS
jgi:hypothetical protein